MDKTTNLQVILICCTALLCSCKTHKIVSDVHTKSDVHSELSKYHDVAKIDTTRVSYSDVLNQVTTIEEYIKVTEYDKESGKPIKKTETKRKVVQDTNKVASKTEANGESVVKNDSTHHVADVSNMIDSKTEEESIGGQESFGKWLGIVLGIAIVGFVIYLCVRKKLRLKMFV